MPNPYLSVLERVVVRLPELLVLLTDLLGKVLARGLVKQRPAHHHGLGGVEHVHSGLRVAGGDLHRCVHLGRGRAANEQGFPAVGTRDVRLIIGPGDHHHTRKRVKCASVA